VTRAWPSETALRIAIGVVAVAGLAVSGYLTAVRAAGDDPACVVGGGCHTVQESEYSELVGIPVAVLGLVAYGALLVAALLPGPVGRALGLFTALVGVGFSAWLTYAEVVLIEAICAWCVTSAALITLALILTAVRAARAGSEAERGRSARRSAPDPSPQGPSPPATPG
jgi:uncharacterized membrane protein